MKDLTFFTANNGKQCFETIKKNSFDLFLLDVMLPDISGWEIFKKLKEGKQKDSKFVFLSAIPVSKDRHDELTRAGISDYITKPFKKNDLIKKVKLILEQS